VLGLVIVHLCIFCIFGHFEFVRASKVDCLFDMVCVLSVECDYVFNQLQCLELEFYVKYYQRMIFKKNNTLDF